MVKDVFYYKEELKKYYDNVELQWELLNVGEYFIHQEDIDELEKVLQEGIKREKIRNAKLKCACGSELKVLLYKGYYDTFKHLQCMNEKCEYLSFQEPGKTHYRGYT